MSSVRHVDGYEELMRILGEAYCQAAIGKGHERHANDEPWHEQQIITIGTAERGFCRGQALKKIYEAKRLPNDANRRELLGAIVYLAAEIYILETENEVDC